MLSRASNFCCLNYSLEDLSLLSLEVDWMSNLDWMPNLQKAKITDSGRRVK